MFGAAAMSLSSVCVVANALRLRNFKETQKAAAKETVKEAAKEADNKNASQNISKEEIKMTKTIIIEGMSCGHCTARVQKALEALEGITAVTMSLEQKSAEITLDQEISNQLLTQTITDAGYEVVEIR